MSFNYQTTYFNIPETTAEGNKPNDYKNALLKKKHPASFSFITF